jgi:hypothetical protein
VADRSFTPSEANSALDQVRPLAERMVEVRARLTELEDEQREDVQIVAGNGSSEAVGEARTPNSRGSRPSSSAASTPSPISASR